MAFSRNNSPREYKIKESRTLAVPIGAYIEYEMIGGGGGAGDAYNNGVAGGNTTLADDTTTIDTADGGSYGVTETLYRSPTDRWLAGGYGIGGGFGSGTTPESRAGEPGQIAIGAHIMITTSLVCTVGSGGAAAASTVGAGRNGLILLKIWPYGQPQDGLPAHP